MFNRKKPQEEHPITSIFSNLSQNQKMSVVNLLATIAFSNGEDGIQEKVKILNEYLALLGVRGDKANEYLRKIGHDGMIDDLVTLNENQKRLLVVSAHDIIKCSKQPGQNEIEVTGELFELLGIDQHEFVYICQKSEALMKHFFGR
jgi:uncharacterized tellurite resistance protein B-like protein